MSARMLAPRVDPGVWTHDKTTNAARLLGVSPEKLVYHLTLVWAHTLRQGNGDVLLTLPSRSEAQAACFEDLAEPLDYPRPQRLLSVLRQVGYLEVAEGSSVVRVHDWAEWQGASRARPRVRTDVKSGLVTSTTTNSSPVVTTGSNYRTTEDTPSTYLGEVTTGTSKSPWEDRGVWGERRGHHGPKPGTTNQTTNQGANQDGTPKTKLGDESTAHTGTNQLQANVDNLGTPRELRPDLTKKPKSRKRKSTGEGPYSSAPFSRFMWWLVEGFGFRDYKHDGNDPKKLTIFGERVDMSLVAECYLAIKLGKWGDRYDQRNLSARHAMSKVQAFAAYKERRHIDGTVVPLTHVGRLHHPSAGRGGDVVAGGHAAAAAGADGPADPFAAGYGPDDLEDHPKYRQYESRRARGDDW